MAEIVPFYDPDDHDDEPTDEELTALEATEVEANNGFNDDADEVESAQPLDKSAVKRSWAIDFERIGLTPEGAVAYKKLKKLHRQTPPPCKNESEEMFFPKRGASIKEPKALCRICETQADCLEFALANDEKFGIWGGTSGRERRKLRKQRRQEKELLQPAVMQLVDAPAQMSEDISKTLHVKASPITKSLFDPKEIGDPGNILQERLETNWVKQLIGDTERKLAAYSVYESATRLAKSTQLEPIKHRYHKVTHPLARKPQRIKSPRPSAQSIASNGRKNMDNERDSTETDYIINESIRPNEARLIVLCKFLAEAGGELNDESGRVKSRLMNIGLPYSTIGAMVREADKAGLITRVVERTKTYKVALTEPGWALAQSEDCIQKTTYKAGQPIPVAAKADRKMVSCDDQVASSDGDEVAVVVANPSVKDEPSPPAEPIDYVAQISQRVNTLAREVIELAKQLASEQQRYFELVEENARLKSVLKSLREGLREALVE